MGYEFADAQNYAVRVFLTQISRKFKYFDNFYRQKTLEYFDYKCPYTGEKITYDTSERDHIIPINREFCGLHVYGNVLIVNKFANSAKGSISLETFLKNEPEKLEKIKKFIKETGYQQIHDEYNNLLKIQCKNLYNNVGNIIKSSMEDFLEGYEYTDAQKNTNLQHQEFKLNNIKQAITERKYNKKSEYILTTSKSSLSKPEIVDLCKQNNIFITGKHTKASRNSVQNKYWANPNINCLTQDWWLTLDDYYNKILYCFKIPANSISLSQLKVRSDKPDLIDLNIFHRYEFKDSKSGLNFSKWLIETINY